MASVVSNLTAAALLLHALLGCCWHHTHACPEGGTAALASSDQSADQHPRGCGHDHDGPDDGHPHPDKCNGPRCALDSNLANKTPQVSLQAIVAAVRVATLPTGDISTLQGGRSEHPDGRDRPPALRSHLLIQVLLV